MKKKEAVIIQRDGRVFSTRWGRFIPQCKTPKGYVVVGYDCGKVRQVHRLVAERFLPNPDGKPFVNHKNGIKDDNRVENLEWATAKENTAHAIKTGLMNQLGESNSSGKLKMWQVKAIRFFSKYYGYSNTELGKIYGVDNSQIGHIVKRRSWSWC